MIFIYKGLKMNYEIIGKGQQLIMLHGYGTNSNTFSKIISQISSNLQIISVDHLGFGKSDELDYPFKMNDYVMCLYEFIKELKLQEVNILGHSFGARIAVEYAKIYHVDKLILVSCPRKKNRNFKKQLKICKFKLIKNYYKIMRKNDKLIKLYKKSGSNDYYNSSLVMKATMSNVIKTNHQLNIDKVKCKTRIIWGKLDKTTPYQDAMYFKNKITNADLITYENVGHFPYIEQPMRFEQDILEFMEAK